jgi:integrase
MRACHCAWGILIGSRVSPDSPRGAPLRNHNFRGRVFTPAAGAIGVPQLTPHDLRHTGASLAVQAGTNVKAVQRMLGHASAAMTLDVYAGLFGDDLDAVADRLDEAAARARADYLRTQGSDADVLPLDFGDTNAL